MQSGQQTTPLNEKKITPLNITVCLKSVVAGVGTEEPWNPKILQIQKLGGIYHFFIYILSRVS